MLGNNRQTIEIVPVRCGNNIMLKNALSSYNEFAADLQKAQEREETQEFGFEDDYCNLLKKYYFYVWSEEELEDLSWTVECNNIGLTDSNKEKELVSIMAQDFREKLLKRNMKYEIFNIREEMVKIKKLISSIKKKAILQIFIRTATSIKTILKERTAVLRRNFRRDIALENLYNKTFVYICYKRISDALGAYNPDGEIWLSKLISHTAGVSEKLLFLQKNHR